MSARREAGYSMQDGGADDVVLVLQQRIDETIRGITTDSRDVMMALRHLLVNYAVTAKLPGSTWGQLKLHACAALEDDFNTAIEFMEARRPGA